MKITRCMKVAMSLIIVGAMSNSAMAFDIKSKDGNSKLKVFGLAQLEARGGDGALKNKDASIKFGAQRIRLGLKYKNGGVHSKLFVDFMKAGAGKKDLNANDIIKDAIMGYKFNNAVDIKLGIMKMPVGMGFTTSGADLDVVERGFDKQLTLERNAGLMISGRGIAGGFGYDVMFANQATRSGAVISGDSDYNANAWAVRGMYDLSEVLHAELAYGVSPKAGNTKTSKNYSVLSLGLDSHFNEFNGKFEYLSANNIKSTKDWKETTMAITAGYYVLPNTELMVKHIIGSATKNKKDTSISNTYLGVNVFLGANSNAINKKSKRAMQKHKLQFNYVIASGDTDSTTKSDVLKAKTDNYFVAVYQIAF